MFSFCHLQPCFNKKNENVLYSFYVSAELGPDHFRVGLLAWLGMIGDSSVDPVKPIGVIRRFATTLLHDPIGTIGIYDRLGHRLLKSVQHDDDGLLSIQSLHREFRNTPIFREYNEFFKTGDLVLLGWIYSFCNFLKKLQVDRDDLESIAFRDWLAVEERLELLELPSWVVNLRTVVSLMTREWSDIDFRPNHGPGHVAERITRPSIFEKCELLEDVPPKLKYIGRNTPNELLWSPTSSTVSKPQIARLTFVPKTYKALRSICMEPAANQYAQQGVRHWMEDSITSSWMGTVYHIRDQTINQRAAREGSVSARLDTIDLSAASDSVSLKLVRAVFPAKVLIPLLGSRSTCVELPDGRVISPHKFSPMGSSTCFPVQSTLYTAIVAMVAYSLASQQKWDEPWLYPLTDLDSPFLWSGPGYQGRKLLPPVVFGDDIICDSRMTNALTQALVALGFQVNTDKSFTGSDAVRESCGGYYVDGVDITPFRLQIKPLESRNTPEHLDSAISAVNLAWDHGLTHVRRILIRYALYHEFPRVPKQIVSGPNPILFTTWDGEESMAIRCAQPRNGHLPNSGKVPYKQAGYQRAFLKCWGVRDSAQQQRETDADWYWYNQRLASTDEDSATDVFGLPYDTGSIRSGKRWEAVVRWAWVSPPN